MKRFLFISLFILSSLLSFAQTGRGSAHGDAKGTDTVRGWLKVVKTVTANDANIGLRDTGGIISVFGNSISQNIYSTPPIMYPYYGWLAMWHGQTIKLHAKGGETYYRGYTPTNLNGGLMDSVGSIETMPTANSKLIIELGFNDACGYASSFDTSKIKLSLDSFVSAALLKQWSLKNIIALSAWYIPNVGVCSGMTANMLVTVNTAIRNECARLGINFVDIHTPFANNQYRNLYYTDNVHWSSIGHLLAADQIEKAIYNKLNVEGAIISHGPVYDAYGNPIIMSDSAGKKIIEGKVGFDVPASNNALVTIPYCKSVAGIKSGPITLQALSSLQYFIGHNVYYNGSSFKVDTTGYSGMWQFAQGQYGWWQSTASNNPGETPSLEQRIKTSYINRLCGFGGNPGNGGANDFSGSAIITNANTIYLMFQTKFKFAPKNSDGNISLLVNHIPDSLVNTITSLPYTFLTGLTSDSVFTTADTAKPSGFARDNEYFLTALATSVFVNAPSGTLSNGNRLMLCFKDNGVARSLAFDPKYTGSTSLPLPTTTTAGKYMYADFIYNSAASKWHLVNLQDGL